MESFMRVFDSYIYNIIDKVKYKDTKKYVDAMFDELGLKYKEVGFGMNCGYVDKVIEKYPMLEKYCCFEDESNTDKERDFFNKILTSYTKEWVSGKIYADKEDWNQIFEVFSKIPRTYNFGFSNIILSGIQWYDDSDSSTIIERNDYKENKPLSKPVHFSSNEIILSREYDFGNKINRLAVVVEATGSLKQKDTSDIMIKLIPYLGQPERTNRYCRFSEEELNRNRELENKYNGQIRNLFQKMFDFDYEQHKCLMSEMAGGDDFMSRIADKNRISKAFKGTDFKIGSRNGLLPGMTRIVCRDSHNYSYEVTIDRGSAAGNSFSINIHIDGYNFHLYFGQERFGVKSVQEAEDRLAGITQFCECIKNHICEKMSEEFGDTPEWYK